VGDEIVDDDPYWSEEDLETQLTRLGRQVAAARALERGLSQGRLAKRAGITKSTVGKIEDGTGNPRLRTLLKVAAALKVPAAELLKGVPTDGNSLQ
jgi:transcriptional regulator with XRE-family HTH domain